MTLKETISRKIIDPDTRYRWITVAYMVLVTAMLMHHVWVAAYYATVEDGAIMLRFPWMILAGVGIILGRMWKDKCFWLLLALLLMKFLRIAIPMPDKLSETQRVYELCVYSFFICYGAGRVLNGKDRKTFVSVFCALWTAAMAVYACFGLYPVLTGTSVWNLGTEGFYIRPAEQRLWPIFHPVEAGTMTASGIAAGMVGFFMTKRKTVRGLYLCAMALMFLMGVFCISRTSYLLTAAGIAAPLSMLLYEQLCRRKKQGKRFTGIRIAAALAAFSAMMVLLVLLQIKIIPAFNALRSNDTALIPAAAAEEAAGGEISLIPDGENGDAAGEEAAEQASVQISTREFVTDEGADGFLTGRWLIWTHLIDCFERFPSYMLIGKGIYYPLDHINSFIRKGLAQPYIYHLHSTFIQTLWESGFPGLIAFAAFFGIFAWNAFRLIRNRNLPLWQRLIPMPALLCWLADMIDCTGYCNWGKPPMTILYLFTGLTIAIARENRKQEKARKGPDAPEALS